MGEPIRVLVADDNALLRMGLTSILEGAGDMQVVAEAGNGEEAIRLAHEHRPDVAVLDVRMPVMDGVQAAAGMPEGVRTLMLTNSEEPQVIRTALDSGADGYLVHAAHAPAELLDAVRSVARGMSVLGPAAIQVLRSRGSGSTGVDHARGRAADEVAGRGQALTAREVEIMELVARGLTNPEIAAQHYLSPKTVKNHVNRIFAKLGVSSRAEAVSTWLRSGGAPGPSAGPGPGTGPELGPALGPELGPGAHDGGPRRS